MQCKKLTTTHWRLAALFIAIAAATGLAGCAGSIDTEKPVGIGATANTLKSSPCACIEMPNLARS